MSSLVKMWERIMTSKVFLQVASKVFFSGCCLVAMVCLTPRDLRDCSPPGSSVHGIFQAGILERVPISFSTGSSQPRDQTYVSFVFCICKWILYHCTIWKVFLSCSWVDMAKTWLLVGSELEYYIWTEDLWGLQYELWTFSSPGWQAEPVTNHL